MGMTRKTAEVHFKGTGGYSALDCGDFPNDKKTLNMYSHVKKAEMLQYKLLVVQYTKTPDHITVICMVYNKIGSLVV